jgi:D-amino peptidase
MRILISADMEGVTGVTCPEDVEVGSRRWDYFRTMLTADVNAAVAGFAAGGADEIIVNEAHASKRNLLLGELDERAVALVGKHKPFGMMEGIQDRPDAVAFVGYHTGAGRPGVLSHTYIATSIVNVLVNGKPASEGAMNAILAAEFGVPVVLVTGDDLCCADAADWAPHAQRVAVKTCVDRFTARCLPPARTAAMIQTAAERSVTGTIPASAEPPVGPFRYEVEFDAVQQAGAVTAIPGVEQTGERRVAFTLPTMATAIRCFKAVTVLATNATDPRYG